MNRLPRSTSGEFEAFEVGNILLSMNSSDSSVQVVEGGSASTTIPFKSTTIPFKNGKKSNSSTYPQQMQPFDGYDLTQSFYSTSSNLISEIAAFESSKKKKRKRFMWSDLLHQQFIAAIFDIGLFYANEDVVQQMILRSKLGDEMHDALVSYLNLMREFHSCSKSKLVARLSNNRLDKCVEHDGKHLSFYQTDLSKIFSKRSLQTLEPICSNGKQSSSTDDDQVVDKEPVSSLPHFSSVRQVIRPILPSSAFSTSQGLDRRLHYPSRSRSHHTQPSLPLDEASKERAVLPTKKKRKSIFNQQKQPLSAPPLPSSSVLEYDIACNPEHHSVEAEASSTCRLSYIESSLYTYTIAADSSLNDAGISRIASAAIAGARIGLSRASLLEFQSETPL